MQRLVVRLMIAVFVLSLLPIGPQMVSRAEFTPAMEPEFQSTDATGQNTAVRDAHKKKCGKKGKKSGQKKQKSCGHKPAPPKPKPTPLPPPPPPTSTRVLLAVGDVAYCNPAKDPASITALQETASYIAGQQGRVAVLGDLAYQFGSADEFANCYDSYGPPGNKQTLYGGFVDRTYPTPGNHEYYNDCTPKKAACGRAQPYFDYFTKQAKAPAVVRSMKVGEGWYIYTYGDWHIYVLNSNGSEPHGNACGWVACGAGSTQYQWLESELKKHGGSGTCSLAYWHHPLFNSGGEGETGDHVAPGQADPVKEWWQLLYKYDTEIVLNGHQHSYERFAPQTPNRTADPQRGIREFIVGTGGSERVGAPAHSSLKPNSEKVIGTPNTPGVLKLNLEPHGYSWAFVNAKTGQVLDSGQGVCH